MPDWRSWRCATPTPDACTRAQARAGGKATVFKDSRELLASPTVDAVFIATPDHWHKTMALDALGEEGRLRREADDLHRGRGSGDHRRREADQPDPAGRQPGRQLAGRRARRAT